MNRILIIEGETVMRAALRCLLERHGHQVVVAGSVSEAEQGFELESYDLVIADLCRPGAPGANIIAKCHSVPVLIMTRCGSVRSAVESMKLGAVDYITKPFDHDEMMLLVERIIRQHRLLRQAAVLKSDLQRAYPVAGMIGKCAAMQEVFERIRKLVATDATVLILGESGTGKELVARALHETSSRRDAPVITVNCAAIPESLIESELFGHERGAFTGAVSQHRGLVEAANGGTLFLDEIGELSPAAQVRLLRVLQEGEIRRVGSPHVRKVNVRLVAATHRNLQERVAAGLFRNDLYFRLHVMEIHLPPLRERGADIQELAIFLLDKTSKRLNRPPVSFSPDALAAIERYPWPGNVRELENVIERAVILGESSQVTAKLLGMEAAGVRRSRDQYHVDIAPDSMSLKDYFRYFVLRHQAELTETELARRLGMSRKALWERRQRLGIPRPKVA